RYAQQGAPTGAGPGGFNVEFGDAGNFSEFFRTIFGDVAGSRGRGGGFEDLLGGGVGRAARRRRGEDVQAGVEISLEEAFGGTRKSFSLELDEPCATCQGSGNVGGKPCATCHGTGWQRARREVDVRIPAGVRTGQKGGGAGDELITVRIVMPAELTAAEKELYERLRALRTDSPRGYAQG